MNKSCRGCPRFDEDTSSWKQVILIALLWILRVKRASCPCKDK